VTPRQGHRAQAAAPIRKIESAPLGDFRPMCYAHTRNIHTPQALVNLSLLLNIQVRRAFVQKQDPRLAIERAREEHSLLQTGR
jgi:hypothetical protein